MAGDAAHPVTGAVDLATKRSTATEIELARRYPGWRHWWSRDSHGHPVALHATRRQRLTEAELAEGLAQTLPFGHCADLAEQLAQQDRPTGADT